MPYFKSQRTSIIDALVQQAIDGISIEKWKNPNQAATASLQSPLRNSLGWPSPNKEKNERKRVCVRRLNGKEIRVVCISRRYMQGIHCNVRIQLLY